MTSPAGTPWSDYHRVPRNLAALVDFLNTLDERRFGPYRPADEIRDPATLTAWLDAHGLLPRGVQASQDDHELALRLRAFLRARVQGRTEPDTSVLTALPLRAVADEETGFDLEPAGDGIRAVLGGLLAQAVLADATGDWARVKMCAADDCQVVFFDHTKPRNARWCHSVHCGNRIKVRTYRNRKLGSR